MIVYVPNRWNHMEGDWRDLPGRQRVNPSLVRLLWRRRWGIKHFEGHLPLAYAKDAAAAEVASMLGLTLRTVRVFVGLERGGRSGRPRAQRRDVGQTCASVAGGGQAGAAGPTPSAIHNAVEGPSPRP
jgi:hypothetical protein